MFDDGLEQVQHAYRDGFGQIGSFLTWVVVAGLVFGVLLCWHMIGSSVRVPKPRPFDPEKDRKHDE